LSSLLSFLFTLSFFLCCFFFFFNAPATTEIYTLSLHDALPISMGTSKLAPSFLRSPGARLTVMRLCGSSYPEFRMAVAQRTFASTQAMSRNPTTTKPGSPRARSTWTSMGRALVPSSAAQRREACTREGLASGVPEPLQSGGDGWRGCQSGTEVPERDSAPARNEDRA